ncbi:hypothetical protein AeMF1_013159 [Aphanomyces euteiches]|nr:hypothetical protein AeMF1_013159 [Aphanomyces euteiches]KAH9189821.1 hypothetical protein AeNC1_008205 [Aphanomyces euteiches]
MENPVSLKRQTSLEERYAIINFLRVPEHFRIMTGSAAKGKAVQGGQKLTKVQGYQMIAEYVNKAVVDAAWTAREAKSSLRRLNRYDSFRKAYQNAVHWQGTNSSGRGLTQKDYKKKIFTVEAKVESICPLFEEMDSLFGDRPNIRPPILLDDEIEERSYTGVESNEEELNKEENPRRGRKTSSQNRGVKRASGMTTPLAFSRAEKKLAQRKDFSTIYMEAQTQAGQLERDKFDYQKLHDERLYAARLQDAKAKLVRELASSGVTDAQKIRELVDIAFPT